MILRLRQKWLSKNCRSFVNSLFSVSECFFASTFMYIKIFFFLFSYCLKTQARLIKEIRKSINFMKLPNFWGYSRICDFVFRIIFGVIWFGGWFSGIWDLIFHRVFDLAKSFARFKQPLSGDDNKKDTYPLAKLA